MISKITLFYNQHDCLICKMLKYTKVSLHQDLSNCLKCPLVFGHPVEIYICSNLAYVNTRCPKKISIYKLNYHLVNGHFFGTPCTLHTTKQFNQCSYSIILIQILWILSAGSNNSFILWMAGFRLLKTLLKN